MTSTSRKGKSCTVLVLKAGAALLLAIAAALAVWMIVNRPPSFRGRTGSFPCRSVHEQVLYCPVLCLKRAVFARFGPC